MQKGIRARRAIGLMRVSLCLLATTDHLLCTVLIVRPKSGPRRLHIGNDLVRRMNEGTPDRVWTLRSVQELLKDLRDGDLLTTSHDREYVMATESWRSRGPSARWLRIGKLGSLLNHKHRKRYYGALHAIRRSTEREDKAAAKARRQRELEQEALAGDAAGPSAKSSGDGWRSNGFRPPVNGSRTPTEAQRREQQSFAGMDKRAAAFASEEAHRAWLASRRPPPS